MNKLPMEIENPLHGLVLYPVAEEIRIMQQDILWTSEEIPIEKDINDYRQNMSKHQFDLASITLDLFVETEIHVGNIWSTISSWFPHSEIDSAAIQIAAVEKAIHAPFYQKMSDTMNIAPEDTAFNQQQIAVIKDKLKMIKNIASNLSSNKLLSLATVALIEQVLLFSNFAMLKSFQANGNNLITNTITGVDFVKNDEIIHGLFAVYLHNTYIDEYKRSNTDFTTMFAEHSINVENIIKEIISHEDDVIDWVYKDAVSINDITSSQLKAFVRSRADEVLLMINMKSIYNVQDNPIAKWFYKGAKSIKIHDFFSSGTNSYRRAWKTENLSRLPLFKDKTND